MSGNASVTGLRSVEITVADVERSLGFYRDVWLLAEVARSERSVYLRGAGSDHHVLVLHEGPQPGLRRINLATGDRASVDALCERARGDGAVVAAQPARIDEPGGGYGFAFDDGEGRVFRISAGVAAHAPAAHANDLPGKLSHVVLNSDAGDERARFFCEVLGFRLRDRTGRANFLGCNADHHSLAFGRVGGTALNHVAYEVANIDGEMRAAGRVKKAGIPIEWGIGRHGPGSNVFCYFIDPDGFVVEYTTEMDQVDDATYIPGTPETWKRAPHSDAWGVADPPTERFRAGISGKLAAAGAR